MCIHMESEYKYKKNCCQQLEPHTYPYCVLGGHGGTLGSYLEREESREGKGGGRERRVKGDGKGEERRGEGREGIGTN